MNISPGAFIVAFIVGFVVTGVIYSKLDQHRQWQVLCFTHIAVARDCADRGYTRF